MMGEGAPEVQVICWEAADGCCLTARRCCWSGGCLRCVPAAVLFFLHQNMILAHRIFLLVFSWVEVGLAWVLSAEAPFCLIFSGLFCRGGVFGWKEFGGRSQQQAGVTEAAESALLVCITAAWKSWSSFLIRNYFFLMQTSLLWNCDLMEKLFGLKAFSVKYGSTTVNCYFCRAGVKAGTSFISSAFLGCGGSIAPSPGTWCDMHMDCTSYVAVFLWFSAWSLCCSLPCQLPFSSVQL